MSKESKANNRDVGAEKNKQAMNRRKLLGSLAVVGGVGAMPSSWVKPVINSVILPAHAQTSESDTSAPTTPLIPGLTLSDTEFAISATGFLSTSIQVIPDNASTSGGTLALNVFPDTPFTTVFIGSAAFLDSNLDPDNGSFAVISAGNSELVATFSDSTGQSFSLNFAINTAGDTLNVSLDLL